MKKQDWVFVSFMVSVIASAILVGIGKASPELVGAPIAGFIGWLVKSPGE